MKFVVKTSGLQDFEKNLLEEYNSLEIKINRIRKFLNYNAASSVIIEENKEVFPKILEYTEINLMESQYRSMQSYFDALEKRLFYLGIFSYEE